MATNVEKGQEALKRGDKQQAVQWFKQAISEDPKNPASWVELSGAIDDFDKKQEALKYALRINPEYVPAKIALAKLSVSANQNASPSNLPDWIDQSSGEAVVPETEDPFLIKKVSVQKAPHSSAQQAVEHPSFSNGISQFSLEKIPAWIWGIVGVAAFALVAGLISLFSSFASSGIDNSFTYAISDMAGNILYASLFLISAYLSYQAITNLKAHWQALNNSLFSVLLFIALTKLTTDAFYQPLSNFLYSSTYSGTDTLSFGFKCLEGLVVLASILAGGFIIIRNYSRTNQ
jgi:hypothetical protein